MLLTNAVVRIYVCALFSLVRHLNSSFESRGGKFRMFTLEILRYCILSVEIFQVSEVNSNQGPTNVQKLHIFHELSAKIMRITSIYRVFYHCRDVILQLNFEIRHSIN